MSNNTPIEEFHNTDKNTFRCKDVLNNCLIELCVNAEMGLHMQLGKHELWFAK